MYNIFNKRLKEKFELYTFGKKILNILVYNSDQEEFEKMMEKFKKNKKDDNDLYII